MENSKEGILGKYLQGFGTKAKEQKQEDPREDNMGIKLCFQKKSEMQFFF